MNNRTVTSAPSSAPASRVGTTGGLSAFALFYLGYAYVYFYLLTAGGV